MIKKILLILIFFFALLPLIKGGRGGFAFAEKLESVKATDYVTDYTNTLSREQILEISKILDTIKKEKNYDVAVVMVNDIEGDYLEHYANKLYEQIGLGNKDTKEGMLWLISKNTHEMRMEVGYGLEPILTDGVTKYIQDNFARPYFKNNDYFSGIKLGVEKTFEVLNGGILPKQKNSSGEKSANWFGMLFFAFVIGVNILGWLVAIMGRSKSWWLGGIITFVLGFPVLYFIFGLNPIGDIILFLFTMSGFIFDYFISKNYKYWQGEFLQNGSSFGGGSGPAWWAGGTSFGGGFKDNDSGFGGFGGGGFSGGGGSNSSW